MCTLPLHQATSAQEEIAEVEIPPWNSLAISPGPMQRRGSKSTISLFISKLFTERHIEIETFEIYTT